MSLKFKDNLDTLPKSDLFAFEYENQINSDGTLRIFQGICNLILKIIYVIRKNSGNMLNLWAK